MLVFSIDAKGYAAILATDRVPGQGTLALMAKMKSLTASPLSGYWHEWKVLPQQITPIQVTKPASSAPAGMVQISGAGFPFKVSGIEIEGFNDVGVDVPCHWEDSPRSFHKHLMHIDSFYVDRYPVTNAEFKKFLDASHDHPKDDLNFLRDWKAGNYPKGWENKPVTWVSPTTTRGPTRVGPESVCPTSGSGSMPPKAQTAASTLGVTIGTTALSRLPANHIPCQVRIGRRTSQGSQTIWRDGHSWKHLAMDGRVRR